MMVDKKMIDQLLQLPDEQLLQMVQLLMPGKVPGNVPGNVPGKLPSAVTMRRIRAVLTALTDGDLGRIAALMAVYQNTQ